MTDTAILEELGEDSEYCIVVPAQGEFVACDRCAHRSFYFILVSGVMLSYCAHHSHEYEEKLSKLGTVLADYRDSIGGNK